MLAPRWAHDPLSGAGAARFGGRWNRPGRAALYLSLELATAFAEYHQEIGERPGTACAYAVDVAGIVDLRDPASLSACGVSRADLLCPWKEIAFVEGGVPPGWALSDRLAGGGAAGLLVPSVRAPEGSNLVLWLWNDAPERRVAVLDPQGDLPRDQRSWPP